MHKSPGHSSDPQTAVAITEHVVGSELSHRAGQRIRLGSPVNESFDSGVRGDQECAIKVFSKILRGGRVVRKGKEFWRAGVPSPQSVFPFGPEVSAPVLIQTRHSAAKRPVLSVALDAAVVNRAELPRGKRISANPN